MKGIGQSSSSHGGQSLLIVMHPMFQLELDPITDELEAITDEELATVSLLELSTLSELLSGSFSAELLAGNSTEELLANCTSSPLDSGAPSQLLEDCASQLQGATTGLSLSQASIVNARSDTAERPHAMLVVFFFMIPLLFLFSGKTLSSQRRRGLGLRCKNCKTKCSRRAAVRRLREPA